jgi:hypothetical protein
MVGSILQSSLDPRTLIRRVSTTLRQVLAKFSEFFMCWVFHKEISLQDRLGTTIVSLVDPQHPRFFPPQAGFQSRSLLAADRLLPQAAVPEWKSVC